MKNKFSFVIVYCWLFILLVCGTLLMAFAEKEERISEAENRTLSGFPELSVQSIFSGDFFLGIESYMSDGFPERDNIIGISERMLSVFSVNTDEETIMLEELAMSDELQGITEETQSAAQPTVSDDPDAPLSEPQESVPADTVSPDSDVTGISGYGMWYSQHDGAYYPALTVTEEQIQTISDTLNEYKRCLPDDGMVFYSSVPLSSAARQLSGSPVYSGWSENFSDAINRLTSDGVHAVNAAALLEDDILSLKDVYFTSDHHWTPRGAISVVNECMRIQGVPTVPYDEYSYTVNTFYNSNIGTKDRLELMHPLLNVTGHKMSGGAQGVEADLIGYDSTSYIAYLFGDSKVWTRYSSGFYTGRNALVIGDSFSNALTPYLLPYYDSVHKVDARYYYPDINGGSISELMKKYAIDDVYIIVSFANGITSETSLSGLEAALYD